MPTTMKRAAKNPTVAQTTPQSTASTSDVPTVFSIPRTSRAPNARAATTFEPTDTPKKKLTAQ